MGREFELKYAADPEKQAAIAARFGEFETILMKTTYYDTEKRQLSARRITLRSRLENGKSVCTLKTPGTEVARGEWEVESDDFEQGVFVLCKLSGVELPAFAELKPICGAKFTRLAKTVTAEGCALEIALDRGVLLGGGREEPLCEVEVELKEGSEDACLAFAAALAAEFDLRPEEKSKFKRALALTKN